MSGPWREPDEETLDLYPGLVVHDGRVSGSITFGPTRLPVWAISHTAIHHGWEEVEAGWSPSDYGWDQDRFSAFIYDILELRGEFARLILVLADAERCDRARGSWTARWWNTKRHRRRVTAQLKRCITALEES